jgi:DNA-binding GntR family transcriptional regulator
MIVQRRIVILPGRIQEAMEEHRQVLKAIMKGDAEKAEAKKRFNIRNARTWLGKYKKWVV